MFDYEHPEVHGLWQKLNPENGSFPILYAFHNGFWHILYRFPLNDRMYFFSYELNKEVLHLWDNDINPHYFCYRSLVQLRRDALTYYRFDILDIPLESWKEKE